MRRKATFVGAIIMAGSAGCGPDLPDTETSVPTEEALSASDVCSLVNTLGSAAGALNLIPGSPINPDASCQQKGASQLTYLGGLQNTAGFSTSAIAVEDNALFCVLKESNGVTAPATTTTGVGRFGMTTKLNVTSANPTTKAIAAQRVGTLTAFGLSMTLESELFNWQSAQETQPAQQVRNAFGSLVTIPKTLGVYEQINATGWPWFVDIEGDWPIGPLIMSVSAHLHSSYRNLAVSGTLGELSFEAEDNRAYAMQGTGGLEAARRNSWHTFVNACLACQQAGGSFCNCPSTLESNEAIRVCGPGSGVPCNDAYYSNLTDGRVPHENRRGASNQTFWDGGGVEDWWHIGKPGAGTRTTGIINNEAMHSIASNSADGTTDFALGLGFDFDVGVADILLDVGMDAGFRSGVALREYTRFPLDIGRQVNVVELGADAEAAFNVNARLIVNLDIPFFSGTVLDESFDILSRSSVPSPVTVPTEVDWNPASTGEGGSVVDWRFGQAPSETMTSCLATPSTGALTPVNTPKAFLDGLRIQIPRELFPCNITICAQQAAGFPITRKTCTRNATTQKFTCTETGVPCNCAETSVALCDAAGKVYAPKVVGHPGCLSPIK